MTLYQGTLKLLGAQLIALLTRRAARGIPDKRATSP